MNIKIILFLLLGSLLSAQNLDSLFNEFVSMRNVSPNYKTDNNEADQPHLPEKCGTGLVNNIIENYDQFTDEQQSILSTLLARPLMRKSIVSGKGHFRIHYDDTPDNINYPEYSPNGLAGELDRIYEIYIDSLGYTPPPSDGNYGGDNLYDIYLINIWPANYGYTQFETSLGNNKFTSFMVISSTFEGYPTQYADAAKVTAAHEFHHAIQAGTYRLSSDQIYYYEITSTAMEEYIYDDINDYYFYLDSYYSKPDKMLSSYRGYEMSIWNIYLEKRFGINIIRRIWEIFGEGYSAVEAMDRAIGEYGSNLKIEYNNFGIWNYHTGYRADPELYFDEGEEYPLLKEPSPNAFIDPEISVSLSTTPISNTYKSFILPEPVGGSDTLYIIITNADIDNGCCAGDFPRNVNVSLANFKSNGSRSIEDKYYVRLDGNDLNLFAEATSVGGRDTISVKEDIVFPQPFNYGDYNIINIPVAESITGEAELNIYTLSMKRVFSGVKKVFSSSIMEGGELSRIKIVTWNGLDDNGEKLASGIYFYATETDGNVKTGKLVIIND